MKSIRRILLLALGTLLAACLPLAKPITEVVNPVSLAPTVPGTSLLPTPPCFSTYAYPFAFTPDSTRLLVKGIGAVQVFDLQSMHEQQFITAPTSLDGPSVALSPDGTLLAWALEGGTVQIMHLPGLKILTTIHSQQPGALKVRFSPAGDRLYTAAHDGVLVAWALDGRQLDSFNPGSGLLNFALSPDGMTLATVSADGPVTLWSVDGFTRLADLGGSGGYGTSDAVFSPDGTLLAADLATGLYLWRLPDGTQLLPGGEPIHSKAVAFSPDGKTLAYADGSGVVLAAADGSKVVRTLQGHRSGVFQLLFSPDGARLVSADDLDIRIWRVADGQLLNIGNSLCSYK